SARNATAMPAALGLPNPWDPKTANSKLLSLWGAPAGQRAKVFDSMVQGISDNQGPELVRLQLCGQLVDRVASRDPGLEDLKTGVEVLRVIGATGNARPAEAHFLTMLSRDLDPAKPPAEALLRQALELRRQAEDTSFAVEPGRLIHPYSERVFPWIQARIEQADERRQQGQDLLFATQKDSWA